MRVAKWDVDAARALFEEGLDIKTVAAAVGVKLSTLRAYANAHDWAQTESVDEEETALEVQAAHDEDHDADEEQDADPDDADPGGAADPDPHREDIVASIGPVELTICTGAGRQASIFATDVGTAGILYRQLGDCLAAMGVPTGKE